MARSAPRRPRPIAPVGRTRRSGRPPAGKPSSVGALAAAMEAVAPARLAESWDNVGLLLGDRAAPCGRVLVAVDWTAAVMEEALALGVDAVVSYHPPIFDPLKRLASDDPRQRLLLDAAQAGIALLSPHTALDAVKGGVNDWLAEGIAGGADALALSAGFEPLRPAAMLPGGEAYRPRSPCAMHSRKLALESLVNTISARCVVMSPEHFAQMLQQSPQWARAA